MILARHHLPSYCTSTSSPFLGTNERRRRRTGRGMSVLSASQVGERGRLAVNAVLVSQDSLSPSLSARSSPVPSSLASSMSPLSTTSLSPILFRGFKGHAWELTVIWVSEPQRQRLPSGFLGRCKNGLYSPESSDSLSGSDVVVSSLLSSVMMSATAPADQSTQAGGCPGLGPSAKSVSISCLSPFGICMPCRLVPS